VPIARASGCGSNASGSCCSGAALRALEDPGKRVGIVLVSTPPGQGLTTLGFSLIARHDAYTSNIKTLERELVYRVEGVEHKAFAPEPGVEDYASALTKIIRRDPDVVLAADISEPGSAKAATLMGLERPLVYVLVPAESMAAAVATWIQAVGDPKTATSPPLITALASMSIPPSGQRERFSSRPLAQNFCQPASLSSHTQTTTATSTCLARP
jgi:hypothetical protein